MADPLSDPALGADPTARGRTLGRRYSLGEAGMDDVRAEALRRMGQEPAEFDVASPYAGAAGAQTVPRSASDLAYLQGRERLARSGESQAGYLQAARARSAADSFRMRQMALQRAIEQDQVNAERESRYNQMADRDAMHRAIWGAQSDLATAGLGAIPPPPRRAPPPGPRMRTREEEQAEYGPKW